MPTGNQVAGVLKTNQDAVKAFLICRDTIAQARVVVAGTSPSVFGVNLDIGGADVRQQGNELLDQIQAYVDGMIAVTPSDDSEPTSDVRRYVQTAIDQTQSDLELLTSVKTEVGTTFQQDLQDLIDTILGLAEKVATGVASVVPWYVWLGLAAVLAVVVLSAIRK